MKIFKYIKKYENLAEQLEQLTNSVSIDGEQDFMLPNIAPSTTPPPPDPDPQTEPQTDPQTDPLTDPETDPQTDPLTDPETDPLTDPQTNPDTIPPTLPIPSIDPVTYTFAAAAATGSSMEFTVSSMVEGDTIRWEREVPGTGALVNIEQATTDDCLAFLLVLNNLAKLKITKKNNLNGVNTRSYTIKATVGNRNLGNLERYVLASIGIEATQEPVKVYFNINPPDGSSPSIDPMTETVTYNGSLTQLLLQSANTWIDNLNLYSTGDKIYKFDGWSKDLSGSTSINLSDKLTKTTSYFAKWVRQFKVLLYKYGINNSKPDPNIDPVIIIEYTIDDGSIFDGSSLSTSTIASGYTFEMWSETNYTSLDTHEKFDFTLPIAKNTKLYAWVYSKITLNAQYQLNDSMYGLGIGGYTDDGMPTGQCILKVYPSILQLLTSPEISDSDWYFKGWAETKNWTDSTELILPDTSYTPTGNKTLYAVYAELDSSLPMYRLGNGKLNIHAALKLPDISSQTDPAIVKYDETYNSFKLHTIKLFDQDNNITQVSGNSLANVNANVKVSEASLFPFIVGCRQFKWILNGGPNTFGDTTYLLDKAYNILYTEPNDYAQRNHIGSIPGDTKITKIIYSAGSSATITVTYKCGYCGKTANIISGTIDRTGIVKWGGTTLSYSTGTTSGKRLGDYAKLINQLIDNQPTANNMPTMEGISTNAPDGIDLTFVKADSNNPSSYYTIKVSLTANLSSYEFSIDEEPTIFNYIVEKTTETPGGTQNYVDSWWPDYILNDKLYLKPGINIIKFSKSAHVAFEVDSENTDSDALKPQRLLIGQLDIVKVLEDENGNSDLGLNIDTLDYRYPHVLTENITVLDRSILLLKDINLADTSHEFYYNMPIDNSTGIELSETSQVDNSRKEILTDPRAWYSMNNVNSKFVISEIDADYLSDGIKVAKSSKL